MLRAHLFTWYNVFDNSFEFKYCNNFKMSFVYMVLLKPSEIRFTKNLLASEFDNGIPLSETFTQIKNGEILLEDVLQ